MKEHENNNSSLPLRRERTRFLSTLDEMLRADKDGAIDDMLRVLLDCGVIRECEVSFEFTVFPDEHLDDPDYQKHLRGCIGDQMGHFLMKEGCIKTEFKPNSQPHTKTKRGSLGVVLPKEKRP